MLFSLSIKKRGYLISRSATSADILTIAGRAIKININAIETDIIIIRDDKSIPFIFNIII